MTTNETPAVAMALTVDDDTLADLAQQVATAEGTGEQRKAAQTFLVGSWLHGEAAQVWRARAAYAFAVTFPSSRGDSPYNGSAAGKAAEALGLLGLRQSQFGKLARAGRALVEAGRDLSTAPDNEDAAIVAADLYVTRVGSGARKAAKGSAGRDPGQAASVPGAPVVPDVAPGEIAAPKADVPEGRETSTLAGDSWAADVLATLARFARNATTVRTTDQEREAIESACAHLVTRLAEEADRATRLAAEEERARGAEVAVEVAPESAPTPGTVARPQPRKRAPKAA